MSQHSSALSPASTMGFADLLDNIGGLGRFQLIHVALLSIPSLLMASHNLLQNFSAAVPKHHCQVANRTWPADSQNFSLSGLGEQDYLHAFIPLGKDLKPAKCQRYTEAQWQLVSHNSSLDNATGLETEPCLDGWTYDKQEFTSTIVSEVGRGFLITFLPGNPAQANNFVT